MHVRLLERCQHTNTHWVLRLKLELSSARISEYESGAKEPNLLALLRYSEAARVHMETLVDDRMSLRRFREALQRRKRSR